MALTPQELEQARTLRLQGRSTDEVFNYIAGKRVNAPSRLSTTKKEPLFQGSTAGNLLTDIPQDLFTGIKQLGEGYQDRFNRLKESGSALARGEQSVGETAFQFGANIAGGAIADPAYQLLRTGASFATTPEQETKIAEGVSQGIQSIDQKAGISDWWNTQSPRTQRNISASLDLVDVLPVSLSGKVKSLFSKGTDVTPQVQDALSRAEQGDVSDATRIANATLDDATREAEVANLTKAYQNSLVGDRVKVNRLLQEQAADMSRGDVVVTQDDLVRALANEGIIPDIRGKLSDFTDEIRNLEKRQSELFKAYEPILASSKSGASIDDFSSYALRSMADSPNLRFELDKAEAQLGTIINNLRRSYNLDETGRLTAKQIDDISRQANARTKAYRDGGDTFQADVYSELGRASRQWLKENIPDQSFQKVNEQWLKLEQIKRTAESMQNQQIDVGILGRALGSYVTTLTGVTLGASVGNPFTSVAAGILTKLGGDAIADAMRSTRFSPEIRTKLQEKLTTDKELIAKLKETATTQENKNMFDELSRRLPPATPGAPRSQVSSGAMVPAGGQTPSGVVQPGITERVREGAIRQPGGERTPTEVEKALRDDIDAVEQAISEMDAELNGATRVSIGDNFIQTADGGAYRFNELPSWIPKKYRDADLMSRVMSNIANNKKPRANASNEIELQKLVEDRIKARVIEIKKGQGDKGVFSGDTAFAIALMAGGSYYLMSENKDMFPVVAIGAMMSNPISRKSAIESAKRLAKIGGKMPESYKRKIASELEQYDAGFFDIKQNGKRVSIAPDSVDMRLEELQKKNFEGTFTDKDAFEAEELMASKGILIEPDFKSGETPKQLPGNKPTPIRGESGKFNGSKSNNLTKDADLRTNREVAMRDVAGNKFTVPTNTVLKPKLNEKGNAVITVAGKEYTVPKNQYDNLKGQSTRAVASEFAPELKNTVETVKGANTWETQTSFMAKMEEKYGRGWKPKMTEAEKSKFDEISKADRTGTNNNTSTKYSQYTLDGGENYREILIQAPTRDNSPYVLTKTGSDEVLGEYPNLEEARKALTKDYGVGYGISPKGGLTKDYQSSHWSEPNVISHIRMNERTVDGKKYAFMEELQSDWARDARSKDGTPNNPLLKDWQIPTTKRALIEAVDSGADRFAWINGEQTSARYNLATHVNEVKWNPSQRGGTTVQLKPKQGSSAIGITIDEKGSIIGSSQGDWKGKKLDEVLGKGLADKIMEKETGTLSGDGLSFGGEWAKNLYDRQVRDIVKRLTGAEVKTVDMGLGSGQTQQYIDLTPEVKAKIQSKAPKFKMKDGVTVAMPLLVAYFYASEEGLPTK